MPTARTATAEAKRQENQKVRYQERKASGVCPRCGKRPLYPHYAACIPCMIRRKQAKLRFRSRFKAMRRLGMLPKGAKTVREYWAQFPTD